LPLPGEEGVEVDLGYTAEGIGRRQMEVPQPEPAPPVSQPERPLEDLATQRNNEAPALPTQPAAPPVVPTPPEPEPQPIEPPPPAVDPRAIYPGPGNQTTPGQNQGTTTQPGDQGNQTGTPGAPGTQGGGAGDGVSFSLEGRGALLLPKPEYLSREQGTVVVTVFVNRQGVVVRALAGARGTTVVDPVLRRAAEQAAFQSRFSPNPDAPEEQVGTISYTFIRIN
ncbi:MAG TPA: hypothetical protein VLH16_08030, partial [Bacteroidales bacterium]|nr:hypothetical protein [Bacteroidales bacterium]